MTDTWRTCAAGCGLPAAPGDRYCHGCGSASDRSAWTDQALPFPPVSRSTDPDTSHAAEASLGPNRSAQVEKLYAVISLRPMTQDEAAHAARIPTGAWKRISDLRNQGRVEDTGLRRRGLSGRAQIVWRAVQ